MKKVWKSIVAILAVTALSLGLLPGNLAEHVGLIVESRAASSYQIVEDPQDAEQVKQLVGVGHTWDEVKPYAEQALKDGKILEYDDSRAGTEQDPCLPHLYIFSVSGKIEEGEDGRKYLSGKAFYTEWVDDISYENGGYLTVEETDPYFSYEYPAGTYHQDENDPTSKLEKPVYHLFLLNAVNDSVVISKTDNIEDQILDTLSIPVEKPAPHIHEYHWTIDTDPSMDGDGVALYRCNCGDVKYRQPIPATEAYVKKLYGEIRLADQGAAVTFDAKKNSCISDYIIGILAQRSDVTSTITFEYKNVKYQFTIPAGCDFTSLLNDNEKFYGFFDFCGRLGIPVNQI